MRAQGGVVFQESGNLSYNKVKNTLTASRFPFYFKLLLAGHKLFKLETLVTWCPELHGNGMKREINGVQCCHAEALLV